MGDLNAILAALAEPVRRGIVERLIREGERTVGEIAAPLDVSTPAVSRHLRILEEAGLIERRVRRQWRIVRARPEAMHEIESWLAEQKRFWEGALDRFEAVAARQLPKRRKS
jgi:DNA-binding transcriptional ArsR family regulator